MRPSVEEIEITKAFRFEAAHRMAKGYIGKCSNIHGHSWRGELSVICSKLDEYGMGIDFYQLDQFLNQIIEYFDHKITLFKEDTELIRLCDLSKWSYVVFDDENPTSERVAKYIFDEARLYFRESQTDCVVKSVMISETCSSKCVWYEDMNCVC